MDTRHRPVGRPVLIRRICLVLVTALAVGLPTLAAAQATAPAIVSASGDASISFRFLPDPAYVCVGFAGVNDAGQRVPFLSNVSGPPVRLSSRIYEANLEQFRSVHNTDGTYMVGVFADELSCSTFRFPSLKQDLYRQSADGRVESPGSWHTATYSYTNGLGFGTDLLGQQWNIWSANGSNVWDWTHDYVAGYLHYNFKVVNYRNFFCSGSCRYHNIWSKDPSKGFELSDVIAHDVGVFPENTGDNHIYEVDVLWNAAGYRAVVFDVTAGVVYSERDYVHPVTRTTFDSWTWGPSFWEDSRHYRDKDPNSHALEWNAGVFGQDLTTAAGGGGGDVRTDALPVMEPHANGQISVLTNIASAMFTVEASTPSGPSYIGTGTSWTQAGVPSGSYTITFHTVEGYLTPTAQSFTLAPGAERSFVVEYEQLAGEIRIETNLASAGFSITGPATFSGSGIFFSVTTAPTGSYVLTFSPVAGFITPDSQTFEVMASGTVALTGTYVQVLSSGGSGAFSPGQAGLTASGRTKHQGPILLTESTTNYRVLLPAAEKNWGGSELESVFDLTIENNWNAWYYVSATAMGAVRGSAPGAFLLPPGQRRTFQVVMRRGDQLTLFADASFRIVPEDEQDRYLLTSFAVEMIWRATSGSGFPGSKVALLEEGLGTVLELNSPLLKLGYDLARGDVADIPGDVLAVAADPNCRKLLLQLGVSDAQLTRLTSANSVWKNGRRLYEILKFLTDEFVAATTRPTGDLIYIAR